MGRAVDWPWGVLELGWALGSGLGGRLWAGAWDLLGLGLGCVRAGLCHGVGLAPGVCRSRAGPWYLGSGVGCGLDPGICWGQGQAVDWPWGVLGSDCVMGSGWALGSVGSGPG